MGIYRMTTVPEKQNINLLYYQCFLAIASIFIFFTQLDNYLFDSGITPAPKYLVIAFCLASIPLLVLLITRKNQYLPTGVLKWSVVYITVSSIYYQFVLPTDAVEQEMETRVLANLVLLVMVVVFTGHSLVQISVRWSILLVTLINVYNNMYELFNPLIFNALNDSGRPAGFYVDPNESGCALILGVIFSINMLPYKYRLPFTLIVFLGAFVTFSRGAIISMILLIIFFSFKRIIPNRQLVYYILGILIIIAIFGNIGSYLIEEASNLGILNKNIESRIEFLANPTAGDTNDDNSRLDIVNTTWESFQKKPLLGNGFAYVQTWGKILPHNIYLTYMLENGFLGAILLPLFVFWITNSACGETKNIAFVFTIFILFWGFFSNTILSDRGILITFALMDVLSKKSSLTVI